MSKNNISAEIMTDFSVNFDRMAKSQGIYEVTKGFNIADTQASFFPDQHWIGDFNGIIFI